MAAEADLPVTTNSHRDVRAVGDSVTGAFGMQRGTEYRQFNSRSENYNDNRISGQTHSEDHKSCDYMISCAADRPGTDPCRTGSRATDPHRYDPPGTDIYRTGRRVTGPYLNNSHEPDYRRMDSCGIDQRGDEYVRSERDNRLYRPPSVHIPNPMAVPSMRSSTGVKLNTFDGNGSLETFLVKFENHATYFNWSDRDRLYYLKSCLEGTAGQILWSVDSTVNFTELVRILRNRFGSEQQAERFRAELRNRRRRKGEKIQELYQDIRRLMALAYPGQVGELFEIVARDTFLDALNDRSLRVRILEREPQNLDEALNIACRLEAYDAAENYMDESDFYRRRNRQTRSSEEASNVDNSMNEERLVERMSNVMQKALDRCLGLDGSAQGPSAATAYRPKTSLSVPPIPSVPPFSPVPPVPTGSASFNGCFPQQYFHSPSASRKPNADISDVEPDYRRSSHQPKQQFTTSKDRNRRSDVCRHCGEMGHWKRDCPLFHSPQPHHNT